MSKKILALAAAVLAFNAHAADRVKVGFISTLSGPSAALGVDIRDGFQLAVKRSEEHTSELQSHSDLVCRLLLEKKKKKKKNKHTIQKNTSKKAREHVQHNTIVVMTV